MNWKYDKHNWYISWYNLDNLPEDSYEKTFARKDITDKGDKDWRKYLILDIELKTICKMDIWNLNMSVCNM